MDTSKYNTIKGTFLEPLKNAYSKIVQKRKCCAFSDWQFLVSGIARVLHKCESGREWIQSSTAIPELRSSVTISAFFAALRSKRRLKVIEQTAENLKDLAEESAGSHDPHAQHPELDEFAIYATDGHFHGASAHDDIIEDKKRAICHIFCLNLRSHIMSLLTSCIPNDENKRKHEMKALKELPFRALRMGQAIGKKVIHVYDKAIIDYRQWFKWKHAMGVYIITCEKEKSALEVVGEPPYDRDDPRNAGIIANQYVASKDGAMLRRVTYENPDDGKEYKFLTNELSLPPGLIAFLYRMRWDIEKVYDETKSKLGENKCWAKTSEAKKQQAHLICMTHNLMIMLEREIEKATGIVDTKSIKKQKKRKMEQLKQAREAGRTPNTLVIKNKRLTQRSLQFIRWLRSEFINMTSWESSITRLRPLMKKYLS